MTKYEKEAITTLQEAFEAGERRLILYKEMLHNEQRKNEIWRKLYEIEKKLRQMEEGK